MTKPISPFREELREYLSKKYGITLIGDRLTLRGDAIMNLIITDETEWKSNFCYMCGCNEEISNLYPATVEIKHVDDTATTFKTFTCADCWCPK
jgi:hypothetical protein